MRNIFCQMARMLLSAPLDPSWESVAFTCGPLDFAVQQAHRVTQDDLRFPGSLSTLNLSSVRFVVLSPFFFRACECLS